MNFRILVCAGMALATTACDQMITIRRNSQEGFTTDRADRAMQSATGLLQSGTDGAGDHACAVRFLRSGSVPTFTGPNTITTDTQMNQVLGVTTARAKVVHEITRCGGVTNVNIIGCARQGTMVVEDVVDNDNSTGSALEGPMWAHEFGHTQGLAHRTDNNSINVMNRSIGANSRVISETECLSFGSPQLAAGSAATSSGVPEPSPTPAPRGERMPVREFARQIFVDSMPIDEIMQYGRADVPELVAMLESEDDRAHWPMAATMLGIIGGEGADTLLIDFIERGRSGRVERSDYAAIRSAIVALGYQLAATDSPRALDYLWSGTDPSTWQSKRSMRWTSRITPDAERRNVRLSMYAVMALGVSGSADGMQMLRARWDDWSSRASAFGADTRTEMMALLEQAMDDNARVAAEGLEGYYAE